MRPVSAAPGVAGRVFTPGREGRGRSPRKSVFPALGSIAHVFIQPLYVQSPKLGALGASEWMG